MKLSYTDILGDSKQHIINAEITTDHPASSYNQPVIVMDDGGALDANSWILLNYQVVKATPAEMGMLKKWISLVYMMLGVSKQAEYLTVSQAAEETGLSAAHIRRMIGSGQIPATKQGHDWMIISDEVQKIHRRRNKKSPQ
jgi:excisionase family DNA binding protein